jgi:hypothetical protein
MRKLTPLKLRASRSVEHCAVRSFITCMYTLRDITMKSMEIRWAVYAAYRRELNE